jgi:hypothetical protein
MSEDEARLLNANDQYETYLTLRAERNRLIKSVFESGGWRDCFSSKVEFMDGAGLTRQPFYRIVNLEALDERKGDSCEVLLSVVADMNEISESPEWLPLVMFELNYEDEETEQKMTQGRIGELLGVKQQAVSLRIAPYKKAHEERVKAECE